MKLRLNRAHYPVTVLGPGRRIGIWFQGCSIHCPGCLARDTWNPSERYEVDLATLMAWCRSIAEPGPYGVTITGGEPFDQPVALERLLLELEAWRTERPFPFDILCYSGYPLRVLEREHPSILDRLDALIPEPFVHNRKPGKWRGSMNQPIVCRTPLGYQRFAAASVGSEPASRQLQVTVAGGRVFAIGIPERGDLDRIREGLEGRGIRLGHVSWRE